MLGARLSEFHYYTAGDGSFKGLSRSRCASIPWGLFIEMA